MASTDEGRELTEAHRRRQLSIAAAAATEAQALWGRLDPTDLDGSTPYWLASNTIAVDRRTAESQRLAGVYLGEYRQAEVGRPAVVVPRAPRETATALLLAGPVRIKKLIGSGMDRFEAYEQAWVKYSGIVRRQTLMGGRLTIAATTGRDRRAIGWRRVTDGSPCAFCAMLAARGPVYRSAASADGLQYHGHCGCTAEPAYSEWEPTAIEQEYVDSYMDARYPGDGVTRPLDEVLATMRASGSFRDSPAARS